MNHPARTRSSTRALSATALALALAAAAAACTTAIPESPPPARPYAGSAAAAPLVIDDFTTGAGELVETGVATQQAAQSGTTIRGGSRCVVLVVTGNPLDRPVTLEVHNGTDSYLALDSGVGVDQAMLALYGYDEQCNARGLDLDLTGYDEFRIDFAALDLGAGGGVVVWSDTGASSTALSVDPGVDFTQHIPFGDFTGDVDWRHVRQIAFEIASGGVVAAHDYVIRSLSADRIR